MNSSESLIDVLPEGRGVVLSLSIWVVMAEVGAIAHRVQICCVEAVLHFHAGVLGHIDMVSPCGVLSVVVLNSHVHVKSLISFLLTILDAFNLSFVLRGSEVEINAVLMALFKKDFGQSVLF